MNSSIKASVEIDFGGQPTQVHFSFSVGADPEIHSVQQAGAELIEDITADELKQLAAQIADQWRLPCSGKP